MEAKERLTSTWRSSQAAAAGASAGRSSSERAGVLIWEFRVQGLGFTGLGFRGLGFRV